MNIANRQEGLVRSPLSHQPGLTYSVEDDSTQNSGGGLFNYLFMLFVVALLVTRRKVHHRF